MIPDAFTNDAVPVWLITTVVDDELSERCNVVWYRLSIVIVEVSVL